MLPLPRSQSQFKIWVNAVFLTDWLASVVGVKSLGGVTAAMQEEGEGLFFIFRLKD